MNRGYVVLLFSSDGVETGSMHVIQQELLILPWTCAVNAQRGKLYFWPSQKLWNKCNDQSSGQPASSLAISQKLWNKCNDQSSGQPASSLAISSPLINKNKNPPLGVFLPVTMYVVDWTLSVKQQLLWMWDESHEHLRFLKIWNRMRPRMLRQNPHARELISAWKMSNKHNTKDLSRLW